MLTVMVGVWETRLVRVNVTFTLSVTDGEPDGLMSDTDSVIVLVFDTPAVSVPVRMSSVKVLVTVSLVVFVSEGERERVTRCDIVFGSVSVDVRVRDATAYVYVCVIDRVAIAVRPDRVPDCVTAAADTEDVPDADLVTLSFTVFVLLMRVGVGTSRTVGVNEAVTDVVCGRDEEFVIDAFISIVGDRTGRCDNVNGSDSVKVSDPVTVRDRVPRSSLRVTVLERLFHHENDGERVPTLELTVVDRDFAIAETEGVIDIERE